MLLDFNLCNFCNPKKGRRVTRGYRGRTTSTYREQEELVEEEETETTVQTTTTTTNSKWTQSQSQSQLQSSQANTSTNQPTNNASQVQADFDTAESDVVGKG